MAGSPVLRRSLIYVPGTVKRYLNKSSRSTADCVIYDLEDSVTPTNKALARSMVREIIDTAIPSVKERGVRINSVGSGIALADLKGLLNSPNFTTIVLPKCNAASDLTFVRDAIAHLRPKHYSPISIIAQIESARSLMDLNEICKAAPELLSGIAFAAEDFALDLSITRSPDKAEFLFARSAIVTSARAHNIQTTLDLVSMGYKSEKDRKQLVDEAKEGRRMGFNGKQCIHPSQVDLVNEAFTPSLQELEWAARVLIGQQKAEEQGRGAWAMDGKMIDKPVEQKAAAILHAAKLCGLDVDALMKKHAGQVPK